MFLLSLFASPPPKRIVYLARPVQHYCVLADVKEDEVFALVGDIRAEIRPHDAVPRRPVLSVEEGLDDVEGYGGRGVCVWMMCVCGVVTGQAGAGIV